MLISCAFYLIFIYLYIAILLILGNKHSTTNNYDEQTIMMNKQWYHSAPPPDMANVEADNNGVLAVQNNDEVNSIFLVTNIFRFVCSSTYAYCICILHCCNMYNWYCKQQTNKRVHFICQHTNEQTNKQTSSFYIPCLTRIYFFRMMFGWRRSGRRKIPLVSHN